jgi:hypothetical protein
MKKCPKCNSERLLESIPEHCIYKNIVVKTAVTNLVK